MSFKRSFLNFSKKKSNLNFLAFIYLVKTLSQRFIYLFLAFVYLVKTLLQLWVSDFMTPKKISFSQRIYDVGFTTKYQRQKRPAFEVFFLYPYKEKGFLILSGSLIRNNSFSGGKFNRVVVEALSLWRESKYGVIISICYNGTLKPFSVHFNWSFT